jgi:recombination protein RecA
MLTKEAEDAIEKKFGKNIFMSFDQEMEVIPTGIPSLDKALGIGGLPKGRLVEIYGPESSGKTTLSLTVAAQCQKEGGLVAFIDMEHALSPDYAKALGVDMTKVKWSQPESGEQALELVETLTRTGEVSMIIIDSVAALSTRAQINGEMGDALPGAQARLMSQACIKLIAANHGNNALILFINQMREKIGVIYGSPETTPGGKALKFYTSIRLDIRRIGSIKDGEKIIGNKVKIKTVKNKLSAPHKEVHVDLIFGEGISKESDLIEVALEKEVFTKKGAWFVFGGENIALGREKIRKWLLEEANYKKVIEAVEAAKEE